MLKNKSFCITKSKGKLKEVRNQVLQKNLRLLLKNTGKVLLIPNQKILIKQKKKASQDSKLFDD